MMSEKIWNFVVRVHIDFCVNRLIFRMTFLPLLGLIGPLPTKVVFLFRTIFNRNWSKIMIFDIELLPEPISWRNNLSHNPRNGSLKAELFSVFHQSFFQYLTPIIRTQFLGQFSNFNLVFAWFGRKINKVNKIYQVVLDFCWKYWCEMLAAETALSYLANLFLKLPTS